MFSADPQDYIDIYDIQDYLDRELNIIETLAGLLPADFNSNKEDFLPLLEGKIHDLYVIRKFLMRTGIDIGRFKWTI